MKIIKWLLVLSICATRASSQEPGDVLINEILFNPVKDGFDYIELYNNSEQPVLLTGLLMANRNVTHDVAAIKILTKDSVWLNAAGYCVITANSKWLRLNYMLPDSIVVIDASSLPSYPDDAGCVVLLRKNDSLIIDEVAYNANWHFKLLSNTQGVSLEKININFPSQDENNWSSSSAASGYGTPGYENSQHKMSNSLNQKVSVAPTVFSPDKDGTDDIALVEVSSAESGKVANAVIYDVTGRRVRYLVKNALLGTHNMFKWDGCDDKFQLLPVGIYILFTQIFDINGNNTKYRNCVVLDYLRKP